MKNTVYISGIFSAILLTSGAMFKINHMAGAGIILTISISFFILFFLPIALWSNYSKEKKNAYLYVSILITLGICFAAALFKIMHWPGAGILLPIGLLAPFIIFLPSYIYYFTKSTNKDITNLIAVLFFLVFVALMDAFLSLGVSKKIIVNAVLINHTTNQITRVLKEKDVRMYENFLLSQSIVPDAKQVTALKTRTEELCNLIDEMRFSLIKAEGLKNESLISKTGEINVRELLGKDNASLSPIALLNTDKALLLKNQIKEYKNYIRNLNLKDFPFNIDEIINVADIPLDNHQENWENIHFRGPLMIWALQKLDMIKMNVKLVESEVLSTGFSYSPEM